MVETIATRDGDAWVITGEKWHVTSGDVADFFLLHTHVDGDPSKRGLPRRQGHSRRSTRPHPEVHAHVRVRASDLRVRGRPGRRRRGPRRDRARVRAHEGLVRRGAADDRRPHGRRRRARSSSRSSSRRSAGSSTRRSSTSRPSSSCSPTWRRRSWPRSRCSSDVLAGRARRRQPQGAARAGRRREAGLQRDRRPGRGQGPADPRRTRLHAGSPSSACGRLRVDRIWEGTSEIQRVVIGNELRKRGTERYTGWPVS